MLVKGFEIELASSKYISVVYVEYSEGGYFEVYFDSVMLRKKCTIKQAKKICKENGWIWPYTI